MEIRDPLHGPIELNSAEVAVLESSACQRLRAIKQLGFAEFSFPGATHNRLLHSLGVCHLAGIAFDNIFRKFQFSSRDIERRFRQVARLAGFLHDVGHGPLSHTTEEVMPHFSELGLKNVYGLPQDNNRRANHEDFTIKYVTDSSLTDILKNNFSDFTPYHIACLIEPSLPDRDDFFCDQKINFRPVLNQIISSEMDVDRMDYLRRDAYFCGTTYGQIESLWLLANTGFHVIDDKAYLGLNRRAIYTFDDFLISRHHMYLMVYFHHKSIIYEEMLYRYLTSKDCNFRLPADIGQYTFVNDSTLFENLRQSDNPWANRIHHRRPYRVLYEVHGKNQINRIQDYIARLKEHHLDVIHSNSETSFSKYYSPSTLQTALPIYVIDSYDPSGPFVIQDSTEIFARYTETRRIERIYVAPEDYAQASQFIGYPL